ncbi:MAG: hypothetical protein ACREPA_02195 [Candidatus Dormibacteraceae bacterium]
MSKFKRVTLVGSEELFRTTRPEVVRETEEVITEVLRAVPEKAPLRVDLTPEEIAILLEAIQVAKYPDKPRPKPPLDRFERLDALRGKLQHELAVE